MHVSPQLNGGSFNVVVVGPHGGDFVSKARLQGANATANAGLCFLRVRPYRVIGGTKAIGARCHHRTLMHQIHIHDVVAAGRRASGSPQQVICDAGLGIARFFQAEVCRFAGHERIRPWVRMSGKPVDSEARRTDSNIESLTTT
jgi:hypothetical protein